MSSLGTSPLIEPSTPWMVRLSKMRAAHEPCLEIYALRVSPGR